MRQKIVMLRVGWPIAAAILPGLVGYFLFADYYRDVRGGLVREEAEYRQAETRLRNSQKTVDDLAAARKNVSRYLDQFFRMEEAQQLIDCMGRKAAEQGTTMIEIQLDIPKFMEIKKGGGPVSLVPFQASFSGDFVSLGSLVSDLEKAPFIYKVTEMGLAPSRDSSHRLTMTVKGAVRFFDRDLIDGYIIDAT